jgi:hypothetical protein
LQKDYAEYKGQWALVQKKAQNWLSKIVEKAGDKKIDWIAVALTFVNGLKYKK